MDNKIIPIVFATDENYVPYCGVAISSLIKNANPHCKYEVFVLFDELSYMSIYKLERLSVCGVCIKCVCIHEHITNLKVSEYNHLTIASAYRLVIPDVFPQYGKIIYLDSDIVVNADVAELYSIDIGDNVFGAVRGYCNRMASDWMYNHMTKTLGIAIDNYFNAGILIFNIAAYKDNNISKKCFSLLSQRKDLYFMDQCALNIVCENKIYFLPSRWNCEWLYLFPANTSALPKSRDEFESCKDPAIIHFDGIEKPWDYPEEVLADYFWKYARQTPFYEEILYAAQAKRTREIMELYGELYGTAPKLKNIAVYGAGNAGRRYVSKILSLKIGKIVAWVDKNYVAKTGYELPVDNVDKLREVEFDGVIIAIENRAVSDEVKYSLVSSGIAGEKIIQIR